jgi:hypothetical protein
LAGWAGWLADWLADWLAGFWLDRVGWLAGLAGWVLAGRQLIFLYDSSIFIEISVF